MNESSSNSNDPQSRHPRVEALEASFARIDRGMRELAIYNPALRVQACGFDRLDDQWLLGVLITPWFMNLTLVPIEQRPLDAARYGQTKAFDLPCGSRSFLYNGDPDIGEFWGHSLHSPMNSFRLQAQAIQEARLRLTEAVNPPPDNPPVEINARAESSPTRFSRRGLLRGKPIPIE